MLGCVLSERVKAQARLRVENAHYQEAINEYLCKQEKPERCQTLREQHVMVKGFPKKPKWPLKSKLKEVDDDPQGRRG
jgi:hypothetical protein